MNPDTVRRKAAECGNSCVFCYVGNHAACIGLCWIVSGDAAAARRGEPDGPPCACQAQGHQP